jgi:CheY-like chemotaxis protein
LLQPLHAARLFVSSMRGNGAGERASELADRIDAALVDAENLLTATLEISKLDAGALKAEISTFHIGRLIERLAEEALAGANVRGLRFRVVPADSFVRSDPHLIARVLRNFISNALRYTKRGGVVLGARLRPGICRVEVWDTGVGIAGDRLEAIFEEFRRFDVAGSSGEGMGLGLAIVERIARLLDVPLKVTSVPGHGSRFAVDLPLGVGPARDESAPQSGDLLAGKTALVIDDNELARMALAELLRAWGCEAIGAYGTADALSALRERGAAADFIIADYHLAHGETGLDAIETLRSAPFGAVPAVVVTSDMSEETRARVGASGYPLLLKPVRADRLRSLANVWFAPGAESTPEPAR